MHKRVYVFLLAVAALVLVGGVAAAQEKNPETTSEVPELNAFHEIIYPIWHTAYPEKDVKALRGFVPQVNELAAKVYAAKLPGIMREKEAVWKAGLDVFRKSVDDYDKAAKGTDDAAMLTAAEVLHAKYEALVRAIRPVLAEVDTFHQALYIVYHKYAPEKQYDKIRSATADLVAKAEATVKATLPAKLEAKAEAYKAATAALVEAAKALDAAGKAHDHDGMDKGVDILHTKYQAVEAIFN
jgi:hypothetical protein